MSGNPALMALEASMNRERGPIVDYRNIQPDTHSEKHLGNEHGIDIVDLNKQQ